MGYGIVTVGLCGQPYRPGGRRIQPSGCVYRPAGGWCLSYGIRGRTVDGKYLPSGRSTAMGYTAKLVVSYRTIDSGGLTVR